MLIQQDKTEFEMIQIILETPEDANKFIDLIEFATSHALENGLDFEFGSEICNFFGSDAVVPPEGTDNIGEYSIDIGKVVQEEIQKQMKPGGLLNR